MRKQRMTHAAFRAIWTMGWRRLWIDKQLQKAYDLMWDGDCEECDAVCAPLPEEEVKDMFEAWWNDQDFHDRPKDKPRSKWYYRI